MYALAKVLGVTVEDLMEDQPREVPAATLEDVQFFREYAGMTDEDKQIYRDALELVFRKRSKGES